MDKNQFIQALAKPKTTFQIPKITRNDIDTILTDYTSDPDKNSIVI